MYVLLSFLDSNDQQTPDSLSLSPCVTVDQSCYCLWLATSNYKSFFLQFVQQNSSANWTSLENSERLMLVITSIDYQTLGSRLLSAILTYAEDQLAAYQSDITEVLTLIEGSNSTELLKKLNEASDNVS